MNNLNYSFGVLIAQNMMNEMKVRKIESYEDFLEGVKDMYDNNLKLSAEEINNNLAEYFKNKTDDKKLGEEFLAANATRKDVKVTASGLQYEVITEGNGAKPGPTDKVTVHYEGTLIDGTIFDSSYKRGKTISFGLNQVIPGWTEGLQLMSVGSKYKLYIPYNLAYGSNGAGSAIPPYAALIFTVELFGIND